MIRRPMRRPAAPRFRRRAWFALGAGAGIALLGVLAGAPRGFQAQILTLIAPRTWSFSDTDDAATQVAELARYVEDLELPARRVQVDLAAHRKVSQFSDIDASRAGFGRNACGPVAAAAALGGADWTPLVGEIVGAAGPAYQASAGIQPTAYVAALRQVFGADRVRALDRGSLGALYRELDAGHVVIVDVKVNARRSVPSDRAPHYAHFARVLGIDVAAHEIYLENTLWGGAVWTVPLDEFVAAWRLPETTASIILDWRGVEAVTRWAVVVERADVAPTSPSATAVGGSHKVMLSLVLQHQR